MLFVGIDPSIKNTGICVLNKRGQVLEVRQTKELNLKSNKFKSKLVYQYARLHHIAEFVLGVIAEHHKDKSSSVTIGYEDYSYSSINKAFTTGELGGVLRSAILMAGYTVFLVPPKRLKKFATNSGNASKERMVSSAYDEAVELRVLCGEDKASLPDDVADAYYLAKMAWYLGVREQAATYDRKNKFLRERFEICRKLLI